MPDINEKVRELRDMNAKVNQMISDLNKDLIDEIVSNPMDGVRAIEGKPNMAIVNISTIMNNPTHIMSAEYYIPQSQAQAVRDRINGCLGVDNVFKAVRDMLDDRKVKIGQVVIRLNEKTLEIIRGSALGQAALADVG